MDDAIYLDNNATTRLDPVVAETMHQVALFSPANPASQHQAGRQARQFLERSRESLARHLGCRTEGMQADQILFTSGGTEANNLAIFGLSSKNVRFELQSNRLPYLSGLTIVSSIEHPSVLGASESMATRGARVEICPVSSNGRLNLSEFSRLIDQHDMATIHRDTKNQISLVSVMLANNETGILQPLSEVVGLCKPRGILVHTDAVQVVGKHSLNFRELNVDAMTVTAHKVHGPTGIGALVTRHGIAIEPQLFGGFQQLGMRPGTECVTLAVGFEKAVSLAVDSLSDRMATMQEMRIFFESKLLQSVVMPVIIGHSVDRLPHTTSIAYPGFDRQSLQMALDFAGIACSTGSACASGSGQPSHVLKAMGLDSNLVNGAIRFSLSYKTTYEELERAAAKINSVVETIQSKKRDFSLNATSNDSCNPPKT